MWMSNRPVGDGPTAFTDAPPPGYDKAKQLADTLHSPPFMLATPEKKIAMLEALLKNASAEDLAKLLETPAGKMDPIVHMVLTKKLEEANASGGEEGEEDDIQ